jgi:hypothetical protein
LEKQIAAGFMATMLVLQPIMSRGVKSVEDLEEKLELDVAVETMEKGIKAKTGLILTNGLFSLGIFIWMLSILLSTQSY